MMHLLHTLVSIGIYIIVCEACEFYDGWQPLQ